MAQVHLLGVPNLADDYDVTIALAAVLHCEDFRAFARAEVEAVVNLDLPSEKQNLNFLVELKESTAGPTRNDGTGTLSLPSEGVRRRFLAWMRDNPFKIQHGKEKKKIRFREGRFLKDLATRLAKTQFIDPEIERVRQAKIEELRGSLRVDVVQFGTYYREYSLSGRPPPSNAPLPSRKFSIEWEQKYFDEGNERRRIEGTPSGVAWMKFEYDHKLIRIRLGDDTTEYIGSNINITFASISKIAVGFDPQPYICFDTIIPPMLEEIKFHRAITGDDKIDNEKSTKRIGALQPRHLRVTPYAQQLRILLYNDRRYDVIKEFRDLCRKVGLPDTICVDFSRAPQPFEASGRQFFSEKKLRNIETFCRKMEWGVAFQIEALLRNATLNTEEIEFLQPKITALCKEKGVAYTGSLLQEFHRNMHIKSPRDSFITCFEQTRAKFVENTMALQNGAFNCCHVTVTPTRMILEGPYPVQSNRIIRKYPGYEGNFLRVDFRDEDKLQYRWAREVDGRQFIQERVGGILKHGLRLGGRTFEFLAYSTSALRTHAVWFLDRFHDKNGKWVTADSIRNDIGDFVGTPLLKCPSKYAARLAQAFTATNSSVSIRREQWEEVSDLVVPGHEKEEKPNSKYIYTDGVGTISSKLADEIWAALRPDPQENAVRPSAFQIRFLGFKGVVSVDEMLDKNGKGIMMRLRPSMRKFESDVQQAANAPLEVAMAFEKPSTAYLNRPLVMALEDKGVRKSAFTGLQDDAVKEARTIHDSIGQWRTFMQSHSSGGAFRLAFLLQQLEDRDLSLGSSGRRPGIDNEFFKQLRQVAMNNALRDIKHSARIPIPESYLLVGVADEGPAYSMAGMENVYELPPGKIYACVQASLDEEPVWIKGSCTISRSPVAHLGDIQRVTAIGKPPEGMICAFSGLKNVVVMSSRERVNIIRAKRKEGRRLMTFLSDLFSVISYSQLLPTSTDDAASYADGSTLTLDRDSTVDDICDFVVEYINSDVLGLLSDRLLILADQSKDGMFDEDCQRLAELCSQAVDYPKQGIPTGLCTDINSENWLIIDVRHAAEIVSPRENDYYRSEKALGELYRAITLNDPDPLNSDKSQSSSNGVNQFAVDPITYVLEPEVQQALGPDYAVPDGGCAETALMFKKYEDELEYISTTHTVSIKPGVRLLESEIVVGTILAKCTQKRWRSDCIYRMQFHANVLVQDLKRQLMKKNGAAFVAFTKEDRLLGLKRAWVAWDYSRRHHDKFAAKSFGLVALAIIFECLEGLAQE
ncbi:unnamed protein product [Mycena citricolor]|uniref:RNA-dependent RNA polymerase n=1 Tax=Mycena citricolor TaxID=2018698 RepID=A0AAD2JW14_9AGAR|nr:unnamed protein product [Mycena citricolor]